MATLYKWIYFTVFVLILDEEQCSGMISLAQPISPNDFPPVPKQFTVKVEMVLPDEKFVEEFMLYWDEELNLARFDYAMGRLMAPFNTSRPTKTIHDFSNGVSFSMDGIGPNCSMSPLSYILTDATVKAPFRPRKYITSQSGNITVGQLLRTLDPRQLFYLNESYRVHNETREILRGIPCEVWVAYDNDFFVPGYGKSRVKHKLYFMTKEFTRSLLGEIPHQIPVQRVTSFLEIRSFTNNVPKIIFNFFDFTVPSVPTLFDFSIAHTSGWLTSVEARESIQIRFPGNFSGMRIDQFIPQFRRGALKKLLAAGELSPLRIVGMYPSQDINYVYITATVLPRPPAILLFTKIQENSFIGLGAGGSYGPGLAELTADQGGLNLCAKSCVTSSQSCSRVAWCNGALPGMRRCALQVNPQLKDPLPAIGLGMGMNLTCDIYQRIVSNAQYESPVIDTLFKVLTEVQDGRFTVSVSGASSTVSLTAEDMRTDVSLTTEDTPTLSFDIFSLITCTASTADSRSSFDFYRGQSMIVGTAAKDQFSKLSPAECRRTCLDEKRFTCHSVASCVHGDCVISDLHGDELVRSNDDGRSSLVSHTHCVVYTRSWKRMFTLASILVPDSPPDLVIPGASNEDTCAKQCLFSNGSCESFSYCSTSGTTPSSKPTHECQLYNYHAFDIMHEERARKPGCWHLSRNYVNDFESAPGYQLDITDGRIKQADIEPSLERWHCAKECIDRLGDDGCLAFDICETYEEGYELAAELDLPMISPTSVVCRISSNYLGVPSNATKSIRKNENCTLYTRSTYLDGTQVNPKTVQRGSAPVVSYAIQKPSQSSKGYNLSDMAGLAIGMLIVGIVITAVWFGLSNRPLNIPRGGSQGGGIPFIRFT